MESGHRAGLAVFLIAGLGRGEPQSEGVVTPSCCAQVFLSSSGGLGSTQPAALGVYTLTSQKIAGNSRPVYLKSEHGQEYYLYHMDREEGPRGWLVGAQLLGDVFFLTTKQEGPVCPGGLYGAWDTNSVRDETFSIECHSDQVKFPCCATVTVSAAGPVAEHQGGALGEYSKAEDVNGHTAYRGGQVNASLFYRKAGSGPDGWMIGPEVQRDDFMVTTRDKDAVCPTEVQQGWDQDTALDPSLRVECSVPGREQQDPGVPTAPLVEPLSNRSESRLSVDVTTAAPSELTRKSINSSARDTLVHSACFRIICILYLLLERHA